MRRITIGLMLLACVSAQASGGAVALIPIAVAATLIGKVAEPFQCHPVHEKLELELAAIEVDGTQLVDVPPGHFYVASQSSDQIIVATADPTSEPPGSPRPSAMVLPVRP